MRNPVWMDTLTVNAEDLRLAMGALIAPTTSNQLQTQEGVRPSAQNDLKVLAQTSPNNTVLINPGRCVVRGDTGNAQGSYICCQDSTVTVGPFADPNRTYDRIDLVVVHVYDKEYIGGTQTASAIEIIQGTAAAQPAVPSTPSDCLALSQVRVTTRTTGGAVISNTNITDARVFYAAVGGILPCTSATRPANPYYGMSIYESDTDKIMVWSTSNAWEPYGNRRGPRGAIVNHWFGGLGFGKAERVIGHVAGTVDVNRIISIQMQAACQVNTAGSRVVIRVRDGSLSGTILANIQKIFRNANTTETIIGFDTRTNMSPGSHSFYLTIDENLSGQSVEVVDAGSQGQYGATLLVRDEGGT